MKLLIGADTDSILCTDSSRHRGRFEQSGLGTNVELLPATAAQGLAVEPTAAMAQNPVNLDHQSLDKIIQVIADMALYGGIHANVFTNLRMHLAPRAADLLLQEASQGAEVFVETLGLSLECA